MAKSISGLFFFAYRKDCIGHCWVHFLMFPEYDSPKKLTGDQSNLLGVQTATQNEYTELLWFYVKKEGLQVLIC